MSEDLGSLECWEVVLMAAERGWKLSIEFHNEENLSGAYITKIDEENRAFIVEKVGERHLKPKLVFNKDIKSAKLHW